MQHKSFMMYPMCFDNKTIAIGIWIIIIWTVILAIFPILNFMKIVTMVNEMIDKIDNHSSFRIFKIYWCYQSQFFHHWYFKWDRKENDLFIIVPVLYVNHHFSCKNFPILTASRVLSSREWPMSIYILVIVYHPLRVI